MSYILNALRKSEQERLAQQPDSVTGRILVNQPPPHHKTSKIIIFLLISNLMIAAGLIWFVRKESISVPSDVNKPVVAEATPSKYTSEPPVQPVNPPSKVDMEKTESPASTTLADNSVPKKIADPKLQHVTKPVVVKTPEPAQLKPVPSVPVIAPPPAAEPVRKAAKLLEPLPENNAIPFVFELEPEFRHTLPDLKINVFVYAEQATERFVMIDMVKYTVGTRIKDSVMLKEIRSDSLVLEYNNRIFRIKRP
ncbi:MAG: GspB domain-containing protein [Methylococcaceae bacterium]|nr:GspB domain-containing protein [Methylococcaceae bacterium]